MNKLKLCLLLLLCFGILSTSHVYAFNRKPNLLGKVIYLDPGHGGVDKGASYKDIRESDIVLEISLKLAKELESLGATVYLTREGDYDLASPRVNRRKLSDLNNRARLINSSNSDMYISIHLNAEGSGVWSGIQTFYSTRNANNQILAETMQYIFKKEELSKRKAMKIEDAYLYRNITVPGVLIELGFITNYSDRNNLMNDEYQKKIINLISRGIITFFER